MATYEITDNPNVNNLGGEWGVDRFKNRHSSRDGHPTAQAEFDRRKLNGEPAVLWKWEQNQAKKLDQCNI